MKKIMIMIITLAVIAGVGGYIIGENLERKNSPKQTTINSAENNNKKINVISLSNDKVIKKFQGQDENNVKNYPVQSTSNITVNSGVANKNNVAIAKSTNNMNSNAEWVIGKNESSIPSTIVIRNVTGKKISNQQLIQYMKKWILKAQFNYSQGCVATMWSPEFYDAVPDNEVIQAFINVNGESALSKNITANEFANANAEVAKLISENQPLLTQTQIFEYIYQNILPKKEVVKIENKKDSYVTYGMCNGKVMAYNSISKYTGITAAC